jgi:hypothetical protein
MRARPSVCEGKKKAGSAGFFPVRLRRLDRCDDVGVALALHLRRHILEGRTDLLGVDGVAIEAARLLRIVLTGGGARQPGGGQGRDGDGRQYDLLHARSS